MHFRLLVLLLRGLRLDVLSLQTTNRLVYSSMLLGCSFDLLFALSLARVGGGGGGGNSN